MTRLPPVLLLLFGATILPELWLSGADLGLWGDRLHRLMAFLVAAFNPAFLSGTQPVWPGQPVGMFVTHVFLHVGFWHMASNMLTLFLLWYLMPWLATGRFMMIYGLSALGGALGFSLLAPVGASMTGASGAISGVAAVWAVSELSLMRQGTVHTLRRKRLLAWIGLVTLGVGLNVVHSADTAWQAHLGGALMGAVLCRWVQPRL